MSTTSGIRSPSTPNISNSWPPIFFPRATLTAEIMPLIENRTPYSKKPTLNQVSRSADWSAAISIARNAGRSRNSPCMATKPAQDQRIMHTTAKAILALCVQTEPREDASPGLSTCDCSMSINPNPFLVPTLRVGMLIFVYVYGLSAFPCGGGNGCLVMWELGWLFACWLLILNCWHCIAYDSFGRTSRAFCRAGHCGLSDKPQWLVGRATVAFRASHRGLSGEPPWLFGRATVGCRASHRGLSGESPWLFGRATVTCRARPGLFVSV